MSTSFQRTKETPEYLEYLRARDSADSADLLEHQQVEGELKEMPAKNLLGPKDKEIKIGIASVLELKAELSRRETQQLSYQKRDHASVVKDKIRLKGMDPNEKLKIPIYSKPGTSSMDRNKGIDARNARDHAHPEHDEKSKLEASWVALQRKAKIYDQMQEDGGVDDDNEEILVDFLSKHMNERNPDESNRRSSRRKDHLSASASRKGEWVQVTDEFGRDRLVRAEEAEEIKRAAQQSYMQQLRNQDDNEMQQALADERESSELSKEILFHKESNGGGGYIPSTGNHFDSKWEKRNLGVGFYQFATNDGAKREQQMLEINNLREETIETRNRLEIQKLKRKEKNESRTKMLQERAKKRKVEEAEKSGENFLAGLFSKDEDA